MERRAKGGPGVWTTVFGMGGVVGTHPVLPEAQMPLDHRAFLPVAERIVDPFFTEPATPMPTRQADVDLLHEAWSRLLDGGCIGDAGSHHNLVRRICGRLSRR